MRPRSRPSLGGRGGGDGIAGRLGRLGRCFCKPAPCAPRSPGRDSRSSARHAVARDDAEPNSVRMTHRIPSSLPSRMYCSSRLSTPSNRSLDPPASEARMVVRREVRTVGRRGSSKATHKPRHQRAKGICVTRRGQRLERVRVGGARRARAARRARVARDSRPRRGEKRGGVCGDLS